MMTEVKTGGGGLDKFLAAECAMVVPEVMLSQNDH